MSLNYEPPSLTQTTLVRLADTGVITSTVEVGGVLMTSLPDHASPAQTSRVVLPDIISTRKVIIMMTPDNAY